MQRFAFQKELRVGGEACNIPCAIFVVVVSEKHYIHRGLAARQIALPDPPLTLSSGSLRDCPIMWDTNVLDSAVRLGARGCFGKENLKTPAFSKASRVQPVTTKEKKHQAHEDCNNSDYIDLTPKPLRISKRSIRYVAPDQLLSNHDPPFENHRSKTQKRPGFTDKRPVSHNLSNDLDWNRKRAAKRKFCSVEANEPYVCTDTSATTPYRVAHAEMSIADATTPVSYRALNTNLQTTVGPVWKHRSYGRISSTPITPGWSIAQAPNSLTPSIRPRAVTLDGSSHPVLQSETARRQLSTQIVKPPSFKRRLLSRMMHGLSISTSSSQDSVQHGRQQSNTPSTCDSNTSISSHLGDVLAAFPTPPATALTSPVSEDERNQNAYGPSLPPISGIIDVQLEVLPETGIVSRKEGQSVPVAIRIKGGSLQNDCVAPNMMPRNMDIAVIIDNSIFASPATLMAQCETARYLASLLDYRKDRLALLCTHPLRTNADQPHVIAPLSPWTIRSVKVATDSVVGITNKPQPADLSNALTTAIDLLTTALPRLGDRISTQISGHIFILTPNANALPSSLLQHATLQIHLVEAGITRWRAATHAAPNGWVLRTGLQDKLPWMLHRSQADHESLFDNIRMLINLSRSGKTSGSISDLSLHIEAGPNCSLEQVMGQQRFGAIRPGEVFTAWAKVRVGEVANDLLPDHDTGLQTSTTDNLLKELDVILGANKETILTAKLSFRHSLRSTSITCETSSMASISRQAVSHGMEELKVKADMDQADRDRTMVQKVKISHLAARGRPREALRQIQRQYSDSVQHSLCSEYSKLLIEELTYQSRTTERYDLQDLLLATPQPQMLIKSQSQLSNASEHFGQGLFEAESFKPQHWLTDAHNGEPLPEEASPSSTNAKDLEAFTLPRRSTDCKRTTSRLSYARRRGSIDLRKQRQATGIAGSVSDNVLRGRKMS